VAKRELKRFLYDNLYFHPHVRAMSEKGSAILSDLFKIFRDDPKLLPAHVCDRFAEDGEARAIADYAAGMTDRFAMDEHERLLGSHGPR
jgi:dGTPase